MLRFHFTIAMALMLTFAACQKKEEAVKEKTAVAEPAAAALSDEQVVKTIETYIAANQNADGHFTVEDTVEGRALNLKLDYVHTSVHPVEDGGYYACADMVEGDSKYDLDFYVVAEKDAAKVSKVIIHKMNDVGRK